MRVFVRLLCAMAVAAAAAMPGAVDAANCRVTVLSGGFAFGTYDPFATSPLDTSAQVELRCSAKAVARIALSAGGSGNFNARQLTTAGGGILEYNVYLEPSRETVWTSSDVYFAVERTETVTLYGRIPARQLTAPAGTYGDSLTLTVIY